MKDMKGMKGIKNTLRVIFSAMVSLLCVLLVFCSCVPSQKFRKEKKQGVLPDTSDFPDTKWTCGEVDMCFYMYDKEESLITGNYRVGDNDYRLVGGFEFSSLSFDIYSEEQVFPTDDPCGYVTTEYVYENGKLICSTVSFEGADGEDFPKTLTFEKSEMELKENDCWKAEGLAMSLTSFEDVDGYFKGEITIDGKVCFVQAIETGCDNYYRFFVENGEINNLRANTTSPLIDMVFEVIDDNTVVARVAESFNNSPEAFPYWTFAETSITFRRME
ncbi:MAG: hypothetical protein J6A50_07400 [Clostridia bacterium]|nr:hypothetical protein [Clostridia bacterium]